MSKDDYDLQALLELREQERAAAEQAYGAALDELQRCTRALEEARARLLKARQSRQGACESFDARVGRGDAGLADIHTFDDYLRGLMADEAEFRRAVDDAVDRAQAQQRLVQRARSEFIGAEQELKAVEKHREAWQEEQASVARRKRSVRLDEIASRRWQEEQR